MEISFYTIGCKLNQAETDELKKTLRQQGFLTVPFGQENICIVRACAVTRNASRTTREIIRQSKRRGAYVIAVGCLENKQMSEIDYVAKNNDEIIIHIKKMSIPRSAVKKTILAPNHTRALVKIQTGCNFKCAYCIIPSFRGQSVSKPSNKIIKEIKLLIKDNYKEVTLTGVNICYYRDKQIDLTDLIKKILLNTKIIRLRLGSLDPRLISNKLIRLYQTNNQRLMPHWHLSLQSGSNAVLKRMMRGYTTEKYLKIIKKLRVQNPLFSFTTDIIVGFPGETEKEFQETYKAVQRIEFSKVHFFPYSPRPGTSAAAMKNQIQDKIKTKRIKKLFIISKKTTDKFRKNFVGLSRKILFEQKKPQAKTIDGATYWFGYSPEYLPVKYYSNKNLEKQIVTIKM